MGGGDHPVLSDEGAPAEVEAGAVLQEDAEGQRALDPAAPTWAVAPCPAEPPVPTPHSQNPPHLQGHLPGPGAGHGVLAIDDPGEAAQHRLDGRDPATWGG